MLYIITNIITNIIKNQTYAINRSISTSDREFITWLQQQNISLAFTTYQTNWLAFIGVNAETEGIFAFQRQFNRAMGLYCTPACLYLYLSYKYPKYQLWQLDNVLQPGQFYKVALAFLFRELLILLGISMFTMWR